MRNILGFNKQYVKVTEGDGRHVTLGETLTFLRRDGTRIVIPEGTTSDGASTPRVIWNIIPPFGAYWKECLLHDYCYRFTTMTKKECDKLLLEAMEIEKVDWLTRKTIYWGVRLFGKSAFDADRKK